MVVHLIEYHIQTLALFTLLFAGGPSPTGGTVFTIFLEEIKMERSSGVVALHSSPW